MPAFFVANRAHHSDVGGMSPGSMPLAREIFQEGLIIPPVKLVTAGEIDRDVLALILANVRTPGEREGDLTAQIAANRVGEARLLRHGGALRAASGRALCGARRRTMRSACCGATIAAIPDGEYRVCGCAGQRWLFGGAGADSAARSRIAGDAADGGLHRLRPADVRRRERESGDHAVRHAVLLSLPGAGGCAVQRTASGARCG